MRVSCLPAQIDALADGAEEGKPMRLLVDLDDLLSSNPEAHRRLLDAPTECLPPFQEALEEVVRQAHPHPFEFGSLQHTPDSAPRIQMLFSNETVTFCACIRLDACLSLNSRRSRAVATPVLSLALVSQRNTPRKYEQVQNINCRLLSVPLSWAQSNSLSPGQRGPVHGARAMGGTWLMTNHILRVQSQSPKGTDCWQGGAHRDRGRVWRGTCLTQAAPGNLPRCGLAERAGRGDHVRMSSPLSKYLLMEDVTKESIGWVVWM